MAAIMAAILTAILGLVSRKAVRYLILYSCIIMTPLTYKYTTR